MSSDTAFATIETTLRSNWAATALVFENEDFEPPDTPEHFVYVEVYGDYFDQASLGAEPRSGNMWREGGELLMHVMIRNGIGTSLGRQYARQLVDLFRGEDIDTLTFLGASIGSGQPGRDFANYWALTASVTWERDQP